MATTPNSLRSRAMALYRSCLRAARTWEGAAEEKQYILQESRALMEAGRHITDPQAATAKLEEGEARLQIALHYKIAYPRMHHADQFEKVPYVQAPQLPLDEASAVPHSSDPEIDRKLAAAARRRRERLAQQQRQQQQEKQEE